MLPAEAGDAEHALHLADERMYVQKNGGRPSAGRQSSDVLLRALAERHPSLGDHVHGVAELAVAIGERLALPPEELEDLRQAAELHDMGKVAIPDAILDKPGPLDEAEWEFMRRHTIIGERILRPRRRSSAWRSSSARRTSAWTARATPTSWPARRSRSRRGSCSCATPTRR